jgi:hypothetical protein
VLSSDYITGVTLDLAAAESGPGRAVLQRIPHAVNRTELDRHPVLARCGIRVDEVHEEEPFPPPRTLAYPAPPCRDCQLLVGS